MDGMPRSGVVDRAVGRAGLALAQRTSRRSFLGRLGKAVLVLAGGSFVSVALQPERAKAFHLCAHIFTTGSCPHPFYPNTRIDQYGYPIHPTYGYPVDDQGRIYTDRTQRRRKICEARVVEEYPFTRPTVLQGTWARCCSGRIRRIVDCCSYSTRRINGDASLTGYCHGGRRVFCITYRETKVRC
jgi:hypothetical protein